MCAYGTHTLTPSRPTAASVRLPLYLRGRERTAVDAEGPALTVRRTGRAIARYPIARLARIIAGPNVHWTGRALRLCMVYEIPIVLMGTGESPVGYIQPALVHRSGMDGLLRQWVDRPEWPEQMKNWMRAQRMSILKNWRAAQAQAGKPVPDDDFEELARRHVQRAEMEQYLQVPKTYRAALAAFAGQKLQEAGICARYWGHGGDVLDLRAALLELLELALSLEFSGLGHASQVDEAARLRILHVFSQSLTQTVYHILGSLHQHVRGLLEEWR